MDFSPVVGWFYPLFGVAIAGAFGFWLKRNLPWYGGLILAIILGFFLTLAQVISHGVCMKYTLCLNRGDVNMNYWLQSFFAIPIYWIISMVASRVRN